MAIVPVGADGNISLYNAYGDTHLIIDVLGYLESGRPADSTTGRVVPLDAPFRVFDTRQPEFGSTPLGFGTSESWSFADFANSVNLGGVPIGAQSALIYGYSLWGGLKEVAAAAIVGLAAIAPTS